MLIRRFLIAAAAAAVGLAASACGSPIFVSACNNTLVTSSAGPVADPALTEISGIHVGVRNPSVWWVHNDSGDTARVFALDATGATRGTYAFDGTTALDWEDITVVAGPTPGTGTIYVADIGDNALARSDIALYRVAEPAVPADGPASVQTLTGVETLRLTYPDGPHDAETLMIDPVTNDVVVVTKVLAGGTVGVYRAPGPLAAGSTTALTKVALLSYPGGPANAVTGGDVSATGTTVAIRTYGGIRIYNREPAKPLWSAFVPGTCNGPVPAETQGEAIGFNATATTIATVSEGMHPTLHYASVPPA